MKYHSSLNRRANRMLCYLATCLISVSAGANPIFDGYFQAQQKKHADAWGAEDKDINQRLSALEKRFGKKPKDGFADDVFQLEEEKELYVIGKGPDKIYRLRALSPAKPVLMIDPTINMNQLFLAILEEQDEEASVLSDVMEEEDSVAEDVLPESPTSARHSEAPSGLTIDLTNLDSNGTSVIYLNK